MGQIHNMYNVGFHVLYHRLRHKEDDAYHQADLNIDLRYSFSSFFLVSSWSKIVPLLLTIRAETKEKLCP